MLQIDMKARTPIYEQLIENIKNLIVEGVWERDTQLPSVRQLAQDLAINPNTIQKAYSELERAGIIYSLKSKGSFVASSVDELKGARKKELYANLLNTASELERLGESKKDIVEFLNGGGEID